MMLSMKMTNDDDEVMHESDHDDDHSVLLQYIYSVIGFYSYSSIKLLGSIHIYLSKLLGLLIFIYQIIGFNSDLSIKLLGLFIFTAFYSLL